MMIVGEFSVDWTPGERQIIDVFTNDELLISSANKSKEEFLNYLGVLSNSSVVEVVQNLYAQEELWQTEEDKVFDFVMECAERSYLWNGLKEATNE